MRKIWINGTDLATLGVRVLKLPALIVPEEETENIVIPGRSETLTERLGEYRDIVKPSECFLDNSDPLAVVRTILEAENVRYSNEPNFLYRCSGTQEHVVPRLLLNWHRFDLNLVCKPLKRQATPDVLTGLSLSATNPGNVPARPKFEITVSGPQDVVLTVGSQTVTIQNADGVIVIDGELRMAYSGTTPLDYLMVGDFPVIAAGETVAVSVTNATAMTMWPEWRWR